MNELEPCPLCEGEGKINEKIVDYNGRRIYEYMCYCAECFCSTPPYPIKDDAIKVWNKRPNHWHIGTPSYKGRYLVSNGYDTSISYFDGKEFVKDFLGFPDVGDIVKWQKIEP